LRGGRPSVLGLACRIDLLQMLPESETGIPLSPRQVCVESHLISIASSGRHGLDLPELSLANRGCGSDDIANPVFGKKENAVGIRDDNIAGRDVVRTNQGSVKDVYGPQIQPLRPGRIRAQAEKWEPDLAEFLAVRGADPKSQCRSCLRSWPRARQCRPRRLHRRGLHCRSPGLLPTRASEGLRGIRRHCRHGGPVARGRHIASLPPAAAVPRVRSGLERLFSSNRRPDVAW